MIDLLGPHAAYIVACYIAAVVVIGALIAWIALDYRAQTRQLADMEARGMRRRSAMAASATVARQAPADGTAGQESPS